MVKGMLSGVWKTSVVLVAVVVVGCGGAAPEGSRPTPDVDATVESKVQATIAAAVPTPTNVLTPTQAPTATPLPTSAPTVTPMPIAIEVPTPSLAPEPPTITTEDIIGALDEAIFGAESGQWTSSVIDANGAVLWQNKTLDGWSYRIYETPLPSSLILDSPWDISNSAETKSIFLERATVLSMALGIQEVEARNLIKNIGSQLPISEKGGADHRLGNYEIHAGHSPKHLTLGNPESFGFTVRWGSGAVDTTPTPVTDDSALNLECQAWLTGFLNRGLDNLGRFSQHTQAAHYSDTLWRSNMQEITTSLVERHREASGLIPPPAYKPFHNKFVESLNVLSDLGKLWLTWLESGEPRPSEAMLKAHGPLGEDFGRLYSQVEELLPNLDENGRVIQSTLPQKGRSSFGDGTWRVGFDIEPGTYRTSGTDSCYWARLSNFTGSNDILANDNARGPAIVTILRGDAGFISRRCGTWTRY